MVLFLGLGLKAMNTALTVCNWQLGERIALELNQQVEAGRAEEDTTLMESHLQAIETRLRLGEPKKKLSLAEALSG